MRAKPLTAKETLRFDQLHVQIRLFDDASGDLKLLLGLGIVFVQRHLVVRRHHAKNLPVRRFGNLFHSMWRGRTQHIADLQAAVGLEHNPVAT